MTSKLKERQLGQYYTKYNPFEYQVVQNWLNKNIKSSDANRHVDVINQ